MRYFTSSPLGRLMMQTPPPRQEQRHHPGPPKATPAMAVNAAGNGVSCPAIGGWRPYRPFRPWSAADYGE